MPKRHTSGGSVMTSPTPGAGPSPRHKKGKVTPEVRVTLPSAGSLCPDDLRKALASVDLTGDGFIDTDFFLETLTDHGFGGDNHLMKKTFHKIQKLRKQKISVDELYDLVHHNGVLLTKVLKGELVIPDFMSLCADLQKIFEDAAQNTDGSPADYIPQLANVDPDQFAMSVTTVDGQTVHFGDSNVQFCIQSTSKPITYALALKEHGSEVVHQHVGREPSGRSFNEMSLKAVPVSKRSKATRTHIPHNPMINAGAIICSSLIKPDKPLSERLEYYLKTWADLCGSPVGFDAAVFLSERATADRNFALGYMMKETDAFQNDTDLEQTLEYYFQTCAVQCTTPQMSCVAATLANGGVNPLTGSSVFSGVSTRNVLSLMLSCGMYDYSGEWAFTIGLPAKSGVSGVVYIVIPNVMGIAIWSPRINAEGNSNRAIAVAEALAKTYNVHLFDSMAGADNGKKSLFETSTRIASSDTNALTELMFAAKEGDVGQIARMFASQININLQDYDLRTALHVACSEGHIEVVDFLLTHGVEVNPRDRWGRTPLTDAMDASFDSVAALVKEHGGEP
eukprot:m.197457 g.197457  ORF g.197457 m.197457 type:complete len:565 (-) comp18348_c0_seq1:137-1831(-)